MPTSVRDTAMVKVNGGAVSAAIMDTLIDLRAELSVGAASRLQVRLVLQPGWTEKFPIASAIEIALDNGLGASGSVFKGEITGLAVEADAYSTELVVTAYDKRHRLGNDLTVRTYVNKSYREIIEQVARETGFRATVDNSLGQPRFPHIIQATTNLAFINDIARRTGMECVMNGDHLRVQPRTAGSRMKLTLGDDLRSFDARYTATERPTDVTATGWDPASKRAVTANGNSELSLSTNDVPIARSSSRRPFGTRKANVWRGALTSVVESEAVARGIARRMTANELTGHGEALGTPGLIPGSVVEIAGIDDKWNGSYYVTAVEHVYGRNETYVTRFTVGGLEPTGLVDLVGSPASHSALDVMPSGVTIGIVTNTKDEAAKHGHVKIKLPYLGTDSQGSGIESTWARVATIGAGNQRGVMFMPEVNDEVLVAFEHGDIRRPYVIGTLWNGKDPPPLDVSDPDTKNKRIIVSRTGHKLTFFDGDQPNKSNVSIVLGDGTTKLHLGKDKIELISNNKPIEIKHSKGSILLKDSGDIELKGMNIKISAQQNVEIEGLNVKVNSKVSTAVAAKASLELKSDGPAKLQSSAITEIKGTLVKIN